jgi:type I restriction enzyme S subunit
MDEIGDGYTPFVNGDVVLAKITPCFENGKGALAEGLKNGVAFGTTELHVIQPGEEIDRRFLFYLSISELFRKLGEGAMYGAGGQKRVPDMFIKDFRAPVPPLPTQQKIADFLDRKTAEIDILIAKKRRLLDLLAEKRTALITRAVTKGLNPDAPMKDSGIEWLGEIPAHWGILRVKFFASVGNGSTPSRDNPEYWLNGYYPWLNSSIVNQRSVSEADQFVTGIALDECHLPIIRPPAILIGITGQGKTRGMATRLDFEATINQHLVFVKPDPDLIDMDYLYALFVKAYAYLRSESDGGGSTKGAITCNQVENLSLPFPPMDEQAEISRVLEREQSELDTLEEKVSNVIQYLREYRSALITNAVTGQIKVA